MGDRLLVLAPVTLFGAAGLLLAALTARAVVTVPAPSVIGGAVAGSVGMLAIALPLAAGLGVGAGVWLAEYAGPRSSGLLRPLLVGLHRLPSVLVGGAGLALVHPWELPVGWVAGAVLAVLALPTVVLATEAAVRAVPARRREAAVALGATRFQVATRLLLPAAAGGVVFGAARAAIRIVGEAAPLVLLGVGTRTVPTRIYADWVSGDPREAWWLALGLVVLAVGGTWFVNADTDDPG